MNFVIWLLFKRSTFHKPAHLLCHGFQRANHTDRAPVIDVDLTSSIPGVVSRSSNDYVRTLKEPAWCRLHALLGQGGDRIIMDTLLEGAIFSPVKGGVGNYYQLSGVPMSDLKSKDTRKHDTGKDGAANPRPLDLTRGQRSPSAITFVRSRMLYAKAALNTKGGVRFGMRHIRGSSPYVEQAFTADEQGRCTQSFPQERRSRADSTHYAIHLSSTV